MVKTENIHRKALRPQICFCVVQSIFWVSPSQIFKFLLNRTNICWSLYCSKSPLAQIHIVFQLKSLKCGRHDGIKPSPMTRKIGLWMVCSKASKNWSFYGIGFSTFSLPLILRIPARDAFSCRRLAPPLGFMMVAGSMLAIPHKDRWMARLDGWIDIWGVA